MTTKALDGLMRSLDEIVRWEVRKAKGGDVSVFIYENDKTASTGSRLLCAGVGVTIEGAAEQAIVRAISIIGEYRGSDVPEKQEHPLYKPRCRYCDTPFVHDCAHYNKAGVK
jgi:hypothetical protein